MDKPEKKQDHCCSSPGTDQPGKSPYCQHDIISLQTIKRADIPWITGTIDTAAGKIPVVKTVLDINDILGSWKTRWGIGRMRYAIEPGLYAAGNPTPESNVFVSANFKMSFDRLRSNLDGIDGWILVLDTKGINVWCAAGKGTFGTRELIHRIEAEKLCDIISHRKLIIPQLGATGVSKHEVKKRSGFRVIFGPVRAADIKAFLNAGMRATPEMRLVKFPFRDRLALVPMELVPGFKYLAILVIVFAVLSGLDSSGYLFPKILKAGFMSSIFLFGAYIGGGALTPMFLPILPGRSFSSKGAWVGLLMTAIIVLLFSNHGYFDNTTSCILSWFLIVPAISSFLGMNFTGSSTYTSLSGVKKEMRIAVPLQIGVVSIGFVLWIISRFL